MGFSFFPLRGEKNSIPRRTFSNSPIPNKMKMIRRLCTLLIAPSAMQPLPEVNSFSISTPQHRTGIQRTLPILHSSTDTNPPPSSTDSESSYNPPEDAIIHIKPAAMSRLIELKQKRDTDTKNPVDPTTPLILRMGVRNGGCSGLSYVMDFSTAEAIQEDDEVDTYEDEGIKCVVDAKSLLYLYGLELDYSDELIGGGFKFFNPNAEESCGCGSSFGV
jgi:iron-sulfur cluster assembly protein